MKFLSQAVKPRACVFDKVIRDIVLDLTNLNENKIEPEVFFAEN